MPGSGQLSRLGSVTVVEIRTTFGNFQGAVSPITLVEIDDIWDFACARYGLS